MKPITTVIIARDAEKTIRRAITSVLQCGTDWPILLVDDSANTATAEAAKAVAGDQITIVKPTQHIGTGNARQTALDNIRTPYGMWLDADDAILPCRLPNMLETLATKNCDLVFDAAVLLDEATQQEIKQLDIPHFMFEKGYEARLFERNWLPALFGGFKTDFAKSVGYDREFMACEDYDFLLRAIAKGGKISLIQDRQIQHYHSVSSVSRQTHATRKYYQIAHAKHSESEALRVISESGISSSEIDWIMAARAAYARYDNTAYLQRLTKSDDVIETYRQTGTWLGTFLESVSLMSSGQWQQASKAIERNLRLPEPSAETLNNAGVCAAHLGTNDLAEALFLRALQRYPDYQDAQVNLRLISSDTASKKFNFTRHPLRIWVSRDSYRHESSQISPLTTGG